MSWKKQTNIPDYQKVLQHQFEPPDWSSSSTTDGIYIPTRQTDTFHTQSVELSGTNHSTYEPSKYGLVADTLSEPSRHFADLTLEQTVNVIRTDGLNYAPHGDNTGIYSSKYTTANQDLPSYDKADIPFEKPSWHKTEKIISPIRSELEDLEQYKTPAKRQNVVQRSKENRRSFPDFAYSDLKSYEDKKDYHAVHMGYSASDLPSHSAYHSGGYSSDSHQGERTSPRMNYEVGVTTQYRTVPTDTASSQSISHGMKQWQQKLDQQKRDTQFLAGGIDSSSQITSSKFGKSNAYNFDSLWKAADNTIREKDLIINRLKSNLVQLNEDCHQYEVKLKHALMSKSGHDPSVLKQIQDLEYEKSSLKSALLAEKSKEKAEFAELELKLGAAESELQELRSTLRNKGTDTFDLKQQYDSKQRELDEWKAKFVELKNSHHELKEKLDGLQRYLSDLPTEEETARNSKEISLNERDANKSHIQQVEEKLNHARKMLSAREQHIRELESKEQELEEQVAIVKREIRQIKSQDSEARLEHAKEEIRQLNEDRDKVSEDLRKATKLLEINHRKYRQTDLKHQNEIRELAERLAQEEQSVTAFREDSHVKDEKMMKLKHSMKGLGSQNQDLLEQNLIMKEKIGQMEQQFSAENSKLQRHLMVELNACFLELQSLVQICIQKAEGQDPNMSALLGVRASLSSHNQNDGSDLSEEEQTLRNMLTKIRDLKSEVETLRANICDKYAEDMGENINCATQ
ncbi:hypothetical protein ScPMuIL_013370 [Solemya velum]